METKASVQTPTKSDSGTRTAWPLVEPTQEFLIFLGPGVNALTPAPGAPSLLEKLKAAAGGVKATFIGDGVKDLDPNEPKRVKVSKNTVAFVSFISTNPPLAPSPPSPSSSIRS
ncbi:hypothetical protein [Piscinibacter sp. XHJ-5]|uniref:hypothetical protein n=1 Tax=Piscinibacter sp. XHJ-5 TaxID=3037797 RepID=UPI0024533D11|nr:hypothetical protein [Piscinibacter sp. XHJ-5]